MTAQEPHYITVGEGEGAREIAVLREDGKGNTPGVFWLSGFKSDMAGTKAERLDEWAKSKGRPSTRFDYSGHGVSKGAFTDGTISRWSEEALAVFDRYCKEPTIVIGSSMGGWIALLLAIAHLKAVGKENSRIAGMVLIAPAPDFTEELMWKHEFSEEVKREIMEKGRFERPSEYSDDPYIITRDLIEDGRNNLILDTDIETGCPVTILQGQRDEDVPWRHALRLAEALARDDVVLTLVKDGDHRLSREEDILRLIRAVENLTATEG